MNTYLQSKLNLQKRLGKGGFGEVCQAYDGKIKKLIAIKIEKKATKKDQKLTVLSSEYKILKHLQGARGVPRVYRYYEDQKYRFIYMQILGPSLGHYKRLCRGKLSIKVSTPILTFF